MVPYHAQCPVYPPSGHEEEPCQHTGLRTLLENAQGVGTQIDRSRYRDSGTSHGSITRPHGTRNIQAQPYEGIPELRSHENQDGIKNGV